MASKFLTLFESVFKRTQQGGLLVGDYVKFVDGFKTKDSYKSLSDDMKNAIKDLIDCDLPIRVVLTKPHYPSTQPGNAQQTGTSFAADIAADYSGGRYGDPVTVHADLITPINDYPNLNPLGDKLRRKDKVVIKPEEVEEDEQNLSRRTDKGDGKLSTTELKLATKNTTLPSGKLYTVNYMKGIKK